MTEKSISFTPLCDELLRGVAIIIDDQIADTSSEIFKLITEIEERHIPCVKYDTLPELESITHLSEVSFIILDWDLTPFDGVSRPESAITDNIEYLKCLIESCFVPIFIFTNKNQESVKQEISDNSGSDLVDNKMIYIRSKSELLSGKLFDEIEKWIKDNPSAYVIKKWSCEYQKTKNALFIDLYEQSPHWPRIFWQRFSEDKINESHELREMLTKNILCRWTPFLFDKDIILASSTEGDINQSTLLSVWEGAYYIKNQRLDPNSTSSGDIFKITTDDTPIYYLNIRPECDCVSRGTTESCPKLPLYLIEGIALTSRDKIHVHISKKKNGSNCEIKDDISNYLCCGICDGEVIKFSFKKFSIQDWNEIREHRIGRLVPPFITAIQQKFSAYLQRQGLPPIPNEILEYFYTK